MKIFRKKELEKAGKYPNVNKELADTKGPIDKTTQNVTINTVKEERKKR